MSHYHVVADLVELKFYMLGEAFCKGTAIITNIQDSNRTTYMHNGRNEELQPRTGRITLYELGGTRYQDKL